MSHRGEGKESRKSEVREGFGWGEDRKIYLPYTKGDILGFSSNMECSAREGGGRACLSKAQLEADTHRGLLYDIVSLPRRLTTEKHGETRITGASIESSAFCWGKVAGRLSVRHYHKK